MGRVHHPPLLAWIGARQTLAGVWAAHVAASVPFKASDIGGIVQDARAAIDDAFHDRGDLIRGERIENLLALVDEAWLGLVIPLGRVATLADSLVVPEDRVTPAVLNTIDERRLHAPAAIGQH